MAPKQKPSVLDLAEDLESTHSESVETVVQFDDDQIAFAKDMFKKLRASKSGKALLASLIASKKDGKPKIIQNEDWHNVYIKDSVLDAKTKKPTPINSISYTDPESQESMSVEECLRIVATTGDWTMPHPQKAGVTLTARNFRDNTSTEGEYCIGFTQDSVYKVF